MNRHFKEAACACGTHPCSCPDEPSEFSGLDTDYFCSACRDDDHHHHHGGCTHHLCLCALPQCAKERAQ